MSETDTPESDSAALEVIRGFEAHTGLRDVPNEILVRSDGPVVVFQLANPTERFFKILREVEAAVPPRDLFPIRATIKKRGLKSPLQAPESRLLLRTLSESLTITRHSFSDDFFGRYIRSVFGAEEQVTSAANHIVFGRRGSGKSSLLLYALHARTQAGKRQAWLDMQVYSQRGDIRAAGDVLAEIVRQAATPEESINARQLIQRLSYAEDEGLLKALLPELKRFFGKVVSPAEDFAIFLDDFHVLHKDLQPKLLSLVYGFARGSRIFLKISAIESFTRLWEPSSRTGLEVPHDAQTIKLDYNLTMAGKATEHIQSILDKHAVYCGLPSVRVLCTENDVLSRLVWVAAGVPRDALNTFAQAMTKASAKNQKRVTVTDINVAASEMVNDKMRDIELDTSETAAEVRAVLESIKEFCLKKHRKNAFLVELKNDAGLAAIKQLIELRLLHVINEGMTRGEAGRRYMALILDYGFYIGVRASRSVDLFNKHTETPKHADLRSLPVFAS